MFGLDTFLPKKKIKIHCRDQPWITPDLKRLISDRQKALAAGDRDLFKRLRNIINRAIKHEKVSYFETQVIKLKLPIRRNGGKPSKTWLVILQIRMFTL